MTIPHLYAPKLLIFAEAAQALLHSSQILLQAGVLEADLPPLIEEAQVRAERALQDHPVDPALREEIRTILRLSPPETVVGLVRDLVDQGEGPDLEDFLETVSDQVGPLRFPKRLVGLEALDLLQTYLSASPDERQTIQVNLAQQEAELQQLAREQGVGMDSLRQQTRAQLTSLAPEALMELVQDLISEEEALAQDLESDSPPPSGFTVVGPLLFMEITDHLLNLPDSPLTPDQRLDLQVNRSTAEIRYRAMEKLGRIDDVDRQQRQIRSWIAQSSPRELMTQLEHLFETLGPDPSRTET